MAPIGTRNPIVSLESGALPACPFPAGTLIVCCAVFVFVHCDHFIMLSNPFHYTILIVNLKIVNVLNVVLNRISLSGVARGKGEAFPPNPRKFAKNGEQPRPQPAIRIDISRKL